MVPLSAVLPMLINEWGKSLKMSACVAHSDSVEKGSLLMWMALLVLPLATLMHFVDGHRSGMLAARWSCLHM